MKAITWNTYFSTLTLGLAAYYLTIIGLYYPNPFRNLLSSRIQTISQSCQQEESRTDKNSTDYFD